MSAVVSVRQWLVRTSGQCGRNAGDSPEGSEEGDQAGGQE